MWPAGSGLCNQRVTVLRKYMARIDSVSLIHRLRSQIVISSWEGIRYRPMAFTEQGVAMLSSVLNSNRAIPVNIKTTIHGGGDWKLWEGAETPNGGEKGESRITTLMW